MSKGATWTRYGPWLALTLLWGAAFSLACRLPAVAPAAALQGPSVVARLLGGSRTVLSEDLYMMADVYFHGGAAHLKDKAFRDVLQKWAEEVAPVVHIHLEPENVIEMMPWLRFATEMDPHNLEAYLVASYWLAGPMGIPEVALEVMAEAQRANPQDYRVYAEKGRLYLILQDGVRAASALDAGMRLWPGGREREDEEARHELCQMLSYRAFIHEVEGKPESALPLFRRALAMFPGNRGLAARVQALERGESAAAWARQAWEDLFPRKSVCARMDHEHGGHEHEHHDHDEHEHEHEY